MKNNPMPNQQNLLYIAILAVALAMTAIAISSLSAVRLQPASQGPVEPFSLQQKEEDRYLNHRLEDLQSALEKHDNTKTFVVQHRLLESPSQALLRKYEQCKNDTERFILLQTLSMKASPKEASFFKAVYRKSTTIAFQRTALSGLASASPKESVEIVEKEILSKSGKTQILWHLYGAEILWKAHTPKAKALLEHMAASHGEKEVREKAKKFLKMLHPIILK